MVTKLSPVHVSLYVAKCFKPAHTYLQSWQSLSSTIGLSYKCSSFFIIFIYVLSSQSNWILLFYIAIEMYSLSWNI